MGFDSSTRHLAITKTTFDISLLDLLVPLCGGGCVVIADQEDIDDPPRLRSLIARHSVNSLQATPSYLRSAIQRCSGLLDGLQLLVGGEPLAADLARELLKGTRAVWNLYGPTEATIWASSHRVTSFDVLPGCTSVVSIGKPLKHYTMHILDAKRNPVAPGVDGELYIAGPAVARAYLDLPDLTDDCFTLDILDRNHRMYRTGDIARLRADGNLEFLGRRDRQVKIRGVRLELGDVESALRSLSGVRDAVVVTREVPGNDKDLVGYVTCDFPDDFDGHSVRRRLGERVPAYMIPSIVIGLRSLPLTGHGKVDYKALPDPDALPIVEGPPPRTAIEQQVCSIFAGILGIESVGPGDNFFDLGGHSLAGMRLINQLHVDFGVELTLRILFSSETVADVIDVLLEKRDTISE